MITGHEAYIELQRIRWLSAFTVQGYTKRKKLNQYTESYEFKDGSRLKLYRKNNETYSSAVSVNTNGLPDCAAILFQTPPGRWTKTMDEHDEGCPLHGYTHRCNGVLFVAPESKEEKAND